MKKLIFAIILAAISTSVTQAQRTDAGFVINAKSTKETAIQNLPDPDFSLVSKNVNEKAAKNFSKTCKNAENVQWFPDNDGSVVYYFLKNKKGIRFYDKKGKSNYEILSYSEGDLPLEIRDKVKQAYYMDYDITHTQEIHIQQKVIYLVQIADKTHWKQLRIEGDEMEVFAEHKIQN